MITLIKILRDRVVQNQRLQGQQHYGSGNSGGRSLTVAAVAEAWQQQGVRSHKRITQIKNTQG
jgi:hypothetical protein